MEQLDNLIDINKKRGLPRVYRFNQFIRWFTLIFGIAAIAYAIWMIFDKIDADSSKFFKFVPFAIMFLALNSVLKNLLSLNSINFTIDSVIFRYIARKSVVIPWNSLKIMELNDSKRKWIRLRYEENDSEKTFEFTMSFPNMLEIVNSIAEMNPDLEFDEFMEKVIISDRERGKAKKEKSLDHTEQQVKENENQQ